MAGEIILGAVAKQIATKLGDLAIEVATLQWGLEEDIKDMEEKFKDLQPILNDVDYQSRYGDHEGEVARRWAAKFKSIVYDTEDMLDKLESNTKSKPILKLHQRLRMPRELKKLRNKIDEIAKEKPILNPRHQGGRRNCENFASWTHENSDNGMIGRDKVKETIISLLLNFEAAEAISIVPIVGLGGVGKTTVAEAVLADKRLDIFDIRAWVHVSNQFDLLKIGKAIIKRVNSSISFDTSCDLQFVHDCLKENLSNKRCLFVLDDLWEEDSNSLEMLKKMLQHGRRGSKIIVTTRNSNVVDKLSIGALANERIICPVPKAQRINLDGLSADDCWKLIKQRVFGPDDEPGILEEIGKQIAAKCRGIPLVASALGQVMSEHKTTAAWEAIRDREIVLDWNDSQEKATLECLLLSYCYMKLDFKLCFAYLAAIPKGLIMDSYDLVQRWIALGYVKETVLGQRCINYLLGMSFLQTSKSSTISEVQVKTPIKVTMHDLVHDMAMIISAGESLVLDATEPKTWKAAKEAKRYCRHAQVVNYQKQSSVLDVLPGKLRSLHFRERTEVLLPHNAFSQSRYLRILDLSGRSFREQPENYVSWLNPGSWSIYFATKRQVLPSSIHKLRLLKYLNVSGLPIATLSKSFHQLQNMQTLIISNCCLETLPSNIGSLRKLCYLDLSGNSNLSELPASLGDLHELFFLNLSGCSKLGGLPESVGKLENLRYLDMSESSTLETLPESLGNLTKLLFLNLSSCFQLTKLPANLKLETLQHLDLSDCHDLENLPQDLGNLQKLEFLGLSECHKVQTLPDSLSQLKNLRFLDISDCLNLRELPQHLGDISELCSLNLTSCPMLKTLPESICHMSKLTCLMLSHCVSLNELPSSFSKLNTPMLEISGCPQLRDLPDDIAKLKSGIPQTILLVTDYSVPGRMPSNPETQLFPPEGQCLYFEQIDGKLRGHSEILDLWLFWSGEEYVKVTSEDLIPPRTLLKFGLATYQRKDFPNWMLGISSYLPNLTEMVLCDLQACESLPPLGQLPNLRHLVLWYIPNVRKIGNEFYGDEGMSKKLRVIDLESMESLEEWWITRSGCEDRELLIPNLHMLMVTNCPKLKFLPYPPRSTTVWHLNNSAEVLPRSGFEMLSASTPPCWAKIMNCNLTPEQWDRFQNLTTLQQLVLDNCGSLRPLQKVILCLASLRCIEIASCKDLAEVLECIGQLMQLEKLVIRDCPEVNLLPDALKNLHSLRSLQLACSGLDVLPEWLGQLTCLDTMVIKGIPNLKSLPDSIKNLSSLRRFVLDECSGLDILPECLGQLTSLEYFELCDVNNLKSLPDSMKNLSSLKKLLLTCSGLEVVPEWLGQLTSLESIKLWNIRNIQSLPGSMKNLSSLRKLQLCGHMGGGHANFLEVIGYLASLEAICLDIPSLMSLPESMKSLTALKVLYLLQCDSLNMLAGWIGNLTSLEELYIINCQSMTSFPESMRDLRSLEKLYILGCPELVESCKGDGAGNIAHIPKVNFASEGDSLPVFPSG